MLSTESLVKMGKWFEGDQWEEMMQEKSRRMIFVVSRKISVLC